MTLHDVYQAAIGFLTRGEIVLAIRKGVVQVQVVDIETDSFLVGLVALLTRHQ